LDPERTSPYSFYQFWLNCSDEDSKKYIRIFTLFGKEEIEAMEVEQDAAPHLRILQKALAKELTIRVHSEEDYNQSVEASEILFGKGTTETLRKMDERTLLNVFEGVPQCEVLLSDIENGLNIVELVAEKTNIFPSKGEARRMLKDGGLQLNKEKMKEDYTVTMQNLLNKKYLIVQKGKKNYFLINFS
jgi:tyrosyl-tRNA synthetase